MVVKGTTIEDLLSEARWKGKEVIFVNAMLPNTGKISVVIDLECLDSFHYAFEHTAFPLINRLSIRNEGEKALENGTIHIYLDPNIARPFELPFNYIAPNESFIVSPVRFFLSWEKLLEFRERITGMLQVEVVCDGNTIARVEKQVEILPYNEWPGSGVFPELLSVFITPNTPGVSQILFRAGEFLKESTGVGSIEGYQSDDVIRVFKIIEALYESVRSLKINYVNPPASFEKAGQKVRFAEEVVTTRQGACLDLALLFAGAIEAAGLHALVFIEQRHAFVGCWLQESVFEEPIEDDIQVVRKRIDLNEMIAFETTLSVSNGSIFRTAVESARNRLNSSEKFLFTLDVRCSRSKWMHPLPVRVEEGRIFLAPISSDENERIGLTEGSESVLKLTPESASVQRESKQIRVERWRRQLLDLSLRNRLLNLSKRSTIHLFAADIARLEGALSENIELRILPRPEADGRDEELHAFRYEEELGRATFEADLIDHKLHADSPALELERKLSKLEHEARLSLEETGANTLFLALGVVAWVENRGALSKERYAPILLVPVSLVRKSVRGGYKLNRLDEETRVNVTLIRKLREDFQIDVNGVDPPPEDEHGLNVPLILKRFRTAIKEVPNFEVRDEVYLGHFSFIKYLLWKDLSDRVEDLKRNDVVNHLIENWGKPFHQGDGQFIPQELDRRLSTKDLFCILEADSSQLAAVANASSGHHFVLYGPPGTGKSQTIANIIAQSIATGKSVLFVAEKRAALEVVHTRLVKSGLGAFCLELHSNKTGKAAFIEQLRQAVDFEDTPPPKGWEDNAKRVDELRSDLNAFVEALHQPLPNGLTAFLCFGILIEGNNCSPVELRFDDVSKHTPEDRRRFLECLQSFVIRLKDFPNPISHPLSPMNTTQYSFQWDRETVTRFTSLFQTADTICQHRF